MPRRAYCATLVLKSRARKIEEEKDIVLASRKDRNFRRTLTQTGKTQNRWEPFDRERSADSQGSDVLIRGSQRFFLW